MKLQELKKSAIQIMNEAIKAVDPIIAIKNKLLLEGDYIRIKNSYGRERMFNLGDFDKIFVVGAGKAAAAMAKSVEDILGDRITAGIISVKYGYTETLKRVKIIEAGHPIPDENSVRGTKEILSLLNETDRKTLIIYLISGGGSALLPLPAGNIMLKDKIEVTELLLRCGADIIEINSIRKHLSGIKGGQLARVAYPATVLTLIVSDVIGDRLDTIASGPTVPDETTFSDAAYVLEKYNLWDKIPIVVSERIKSGLSNEIVDTPKKGDEVFENVYNYIVVSNIHALKAAKYSAEALGLNALILSSSIQGETRDVARVHAAIAREIRTTGNPLSPPACIVTGGETTITVRGKGKGGRNQEFALAAAINITGIKDMVILSVDSDGTDGLTDAAGGIVDGDSLKRASELGLDPLVYLDNNDSYNFLKGIDSLIITGPTNTNVMDIRLILVG